MRTVTKYIADDGSEFNNESKCSSYEQTARLIAEAMKLLHPIPEDCDFGNGHGYIQQSKAAYEATLKMLCQIISTLYKDGLIQRWCEEVSRGERHPSHVGRMLDDADNKALNRAWYRIMCIDKQYREWGQIYYVAHPQDGKSTCLNKE